MVRRSTTSSIPVPASQPTVRGVPHRKAHTAVEANTASTAALVLGESAVDWLVARDATARLVDTDGRVVKVGDWPTETAAA